MARELAQAIREEHQHLYAQIESLRSVLYDDSDVQHTTRTSRLSDIVPWFREHLLPHARKEETHLYSEVDRLANSQGAKATQTMLMDHERIRALVGQLEELLADPSTHGDRHDDWVYMVAAQLEVLLTSHFEKEEAVYLRLLDSAT